MVYQAESVCTQGCFCFSTKFVDHTRRKDSEEMWMMLFVACIDLFVEVFVVCVAMICEHKRDGVLLLAHLGHKVGQIMVNALDSGTVGIMCNIENCEGEKFFLFKKGKN